MLSLLILLVSSLPAFADPHPCEALLARIVPKEPVAALPGSLIHHKIYGEGNKETVVLIHGLRGSLDTWKELAPRLASKYRVIVYDQRGHGLTPAIGENYSSRVMASDLKSLLDHLGVKGKVHVLGHSMGARTAVRFAEQNPDRVASVVLEDMHLVGRRTALEDPRPIAQEIRSLVEAEYRTKEEATAALKRFAKLETPELGEELDPELIEKVVVKLRGSYRLALSPVTHSSRLYATQALQEDLSSALAGVQAPLLAIQADPAKGAVLWGKGIDHLRKTKPDALVVGIPGSDHSVHKTHLDPYEELLRKFLAGKKLEHAPLLGEPPKEP